jgi:putative mRNA 3-end processing factor
MIREMRRYLKVGWLKGLHIQTPETRLIIDPTISRLPPDAVVLISHAHSDHTRGFTSSNLKVATNETKRIFEVLTGRNIERFRELPINSSLKIEDIEIEALNSGHMVGSAQFKISTPEGVILYTGDLNNVDSLIVEAAEPVECDLLIMEATYGKPFYIFPSRRGIYTDIVKWSLNEIKHGNIPCFRVYAAGKAQEIVKLFNDYTKIPVISDLKIHNVNRVCNNQHLKLRWNVTDEEPITRKDPSIFVTTQRRYFNNGLSEARATGWNIKMKNSGVMSFPLSGHADFYQLRKYVADTKAKKIYVFTGFIKDFTEYLNKRGIEACPIPSIHQRGLLDFI